MKVLAVLVAASTLVAAAPENFKRQAAGAGKTTTPKGCLKLDTDADWPSENEWKTEFPGILPRSVFAEGLENKTRPNWRLREKTVEEIQKAVKFVAKHNIRLSIINSGHDFNGRNDAPSGLVIDTSLFRGVRIVEEFTPTAKGAPPLARELKPNKLTAVPGKQAAVTFGVGLSTQTLNNALHDSRLVSVGAASNWVTVAGGWGQTAGHSPLSNLHGLGVDQFLEFKIVTADGELKVVNKASYPDLFWALRGGGGGTWGVVVEATVKVYPTPPITLRTMTFNATGNNTDDLFHAYSYLHSHFVDFVEKHQMTGYYYLYHTWFRSVWMHKAEGSGKSKVEAIWNPIVEKLKTYKGITEPKIATTDFGSFKEYFDARFGPAAPVPTNEDELEGPEPTDMANLDSRLFGAEHFKHPNLTQLLRAAVPPGDLALQGHLVGGGKVFKPTEDVSVLPAWRKAYVHVISNRVKGKSSADSLRTLAPDTGAYVNEDFVGDVDWKKTWWGTNYAKLSGIKSKYDPNIVFWATPGINADHREVREGRVCTVSDPVEKSTAPLSDNRNNARVLSNL